ncbi:hypothetical protein ACH5RR_029114 [Cinchona calisaya]|uniref:Uncharacterized protein n=1 Tax=Cinchona calisaya TaxID=153742 RepID=A0ABD2YQT3_9GENT
MPRGQENLTKGSTSTRNAASPDSDKARKLIRASIRATMLTFELNLTPILDVIPAATSMDIENLVGVIVANTTQTLVDVVNAELLEWRLELLGPAPAATTIT